MMEILYGKLPLKYFKPYRNEINKGWRIDFQIHGQKEEKENYYKLSEHILNLLAKSFLKVSPKNRMNITTGLKIIK